MWDTFSGTCLHTFAHQHIVRSVAINSAGSRIITGGHEKKLRLFDLERPDAEPSFLRETAGSTSEAVHAGNIKSVVWERRGEEEVVSAAEDRTVK